MQVFLNKILRRYKTGMKIFPFLKKRQLFGKFNLTHAQSSNILGFENSELSLSKNVSDIKNCAPPYMLCCCIYYQFSLLEIAFVKSIAFSDNIL